MEKITQRDLENRVTRLNKITGIKKPSYNVKDCYHLDYAYGGVSLYRYIGKYGAVNDIFRCGHVTKRELYNRINAYIDGIKL